MRTVLHADMDAFYASIEQRDRPELRGRPVIVGGTSDRGVVSAASYEARRFGVHSAMPTAQARARCPDAVFLRGDMAKYQAESRAIFAIFGDFSPSVEGLSLDEAFLDLTGTERLFGPPEGVAARLRARIRAERGLAVSVGIAPVKMVAKIASDVAKPDGTRLVAPGEVESFLAPLPVGRIWGVGRVAQARLAELGIATIGDLARLSDRHIATALGPWGLRMAALARGHDDRDVEPFREAKSYGEENTFGRDVSDSAVLRHAIRAHAEAVARRLRKDELRGHVVQLKIKLARRLGGGRFPLMTRQTKLAKATNDGREIARAADTLLERAAIAEPVRLIGVSLSDLEPERGRQLSLFSDPASAESRRELNRTMDQIRARFGSEALRVGQAQAERSGDSGQIKRGED